MTNRQRSKGFTLIELLVAVAIIGVLSTLAVYAANEAKKNGRDAKRIGDVSSVQTALDLYYAEYRRYPPGTDLMLGTVPATALCDTGWSAEPCAVTAYMLRVPAAPSVPDGPCSEEENDYVYNDVNGGGDYTLTFCLGKAIGSLVEGLHVGNADGIR